MWKVVENNRNNRSQSKHPQIKMRLWHIGSVLIISTTLLIASQMPATAFFLGNLEQRISGIIQQPSAENKPARQEQTLSTGFNTIRVIFVILLAGLAISSKLKPEKTENKPNKIKQHSGELK